MKEYVRMSILQEYENHRKIIKKDIMLALEEYLNSQNKNGKDLSYADVIYKPDKWRDFMEWCELKYNKRYGRGDKSNKRL